jgi:hypothetical protein
MTTVFEKQIGVPATHAIVIGVGAYTHLVGGDGALFRDHEGMGQLNSPPYSARAFACWLMSKYRNPKKPLASLELLLSDAQNHEFTFPDGEVTQVENASKANVKRSVRCWIERGDQSRDNLVIFYFCGHGIASGPETALLLDDFGEWQNAPLENAIDFRGLHLGMDKCRAREQTYFIDACRTASPTLIESFNYSGDPIIQGSARHSTFGRRHAPVYYSTVAGNRAYGRFGVPSVFTEALLMALNGAGSDDVEGDWRIYSDMLNRGIGYTLEIVKGDAIKLDQIISVDGLTRFTLHYLDGKPIVPVTIGCNPSMANRLAKLSYSDGSKDVVRLHKEETNWDVNMEVGDYRFSAKFQGGPFVDKDKQGHVRPPFRRITIVV